MKKTVYRFSQISAIIIFCISILLIGFIIYDPPMYYPSGGEMGSINEESPDPPQKVDFLSIAISVLTLLFTGISTFAGVFLGWRNDRRELKESELRIKELEIKLKEKMKDNDVLL